MTESSAAVPITLTERAARRIVDLLKEEPPSTKLRVAVSGGGCSGFAYGFSLDDHQDETDLVIEHEGAVVVIDDLSVMYLAGSEIDYVDALEGSHFALNNPNATSSCSCGNSFSVG